MLQMSTKGRYGTRLMLYLACNYDNGLSLLKTIAENEEISEGYLEHLIPLLKSAGLLVSVRGANGGYRLSRDPRTITLREVVETMEGSLVPTNCIDKPLSCSRSTECVTRDVWNELGEQIKEHLEKISLADMVQKQKEKSNQTLMYNI